PTDDLTVRQALAHAIDKQRIINNLRNGIPPKSFGPFARGSPYHSSTGYAWFDLDRARALVNRYEQEKGPVSVQLMTENTSTRAGPAPTLRSGRPPIRTWPARSHPSFPTSGRTGPSGWWPPSAKCRTSPARPCRTAPRPSP